MASREEASVQPRRCSAALRVVLDRARTAPRVRIAACTAPRVRSEACTVPRTYRRVCAAAPRTYRRVLPECAAGSRPLQRATQRRIALLTSHKSRAVDLFSTCVFRLSFEHVYELKKLRGIRSCMRWLAACNTLASRWKLKNCGTTSIVMINADKHKSATFLQRAGPAPFNLSISRQLGGGLPRRRGARKQQ